MNEPISKLLIEIQKIPIYNERTMFPFNFDFNRHTFTGILIGILLVAVVRARFGF